MKKLLLLLIIIGCLLLIGCGVNEGIIVNKEFVPAHWVGIVGKGGIWNQIDGTYMYRVIILKVNYKPIHGVYRCMNLII
jgi:uncharacterized protein YcfL